MSTGISSSGRGIVDGVILTIITASCVGTAAVGVFCEHAARDLSLQARGLMHAAAGARFIPLRRAWTTR